MKKLVTAFLLSSVTCVSYGAVIPLFSYNDCLELAKVPVDSPGVCTTFQLIAHQETVQQGDTFNVTCTFSAGIHTNDVIPVDVNARIGSSVAITSGPLIPTNQWGPISTQDEAIVKYSWTGIATADLYGSNFGISFSAPDLRQGQTIKLSCINN